MKTRVKREWGRREEEDEGKEGMKTRGKRWMIKMRRRKRGRDEDKRKRGCDDARKMKKRRRRGRYANNGKKVTG